MKLSRDVWLSNATGWEVHNLTLYFGKGSDLAPTAPELRALVTDSAAGVRTLVCTKLPTERVEALHTLTTAGFSVVDTAITLSRPCTPATETVVASVDVREAIPGDCEVVAAIAENVFTYSRFHLDPQIPKHIANGIKREWVLSYFHGNRGERLLVATHGSRPVGFLAMLAQAREDERCAVIDLMGVELAHQGKGVGRALVKAMISQAAKGRLDARVGTQAANVASLQLYESCGFRVQHTEYVLHAHVHAGMPS